MAEDYIKEIEDLKRAAAEEKKLLELREEKLKNAKQTAEVQKKLLDNQVKQIENQIQILKLDAKTAENDEERTKKLKEILELDEKLEKANEKLKKSEEALQESKERNFKTTLNQIDVYKKLESAMGALKNPYAALGKALNYLINLSIAATKTYDEQRAALAKLTGGLSRYNQELADGMNQASLSGVTMKEFGESFNAAAGELTSFGSLSASTRKEIGTLAAQMSRLGMDNFIKNLEMGVQGLGMTQDQAMEAQKELLGLGSALGPRFKKMIDSDFGPAMESLAAHTKGKAIQVFKELAIQSKKTGLELSKLRAFAEQFDTFEGAASAVGKLNAALGGNYFNSLELLRASESERVDIIRQGIALSGKRFQDLSRFEKKFVAQSLGLSSVAEAQKLLRTEQEKEAEELERLTKQGEKFGLSAEEMKERITATQKVSEQFKMAMQNLAFAFKPVIDFLAKVAKFLAGLMEGFKKADQSGRALAVGLGILLGSLVAIKLALTGIGALLGSLGFAGAAGGAAAGGAAAAGGLAALKGLGIVALGLAVAGTALYFLGAVVMPALGIGFKKLSEGLTPLMEALSKAGGAFNVVKELGILFAGIAGLTTMSGILTLAGGAVSAIGGMFGAGGQLEKATKLVNTVKKLKNAEAEKLTVNLNEIRVVGDLDYKVTIDFANLDKSKEDLEKTIKKLGNEIAKLNSVKMTLAGGFSS